MGIPKITWYVNEENVYTPETDFYAGNFSAGETVTVKLQVWNNRWGTTAVDTLSDAVLNLRFDTVEDSALLSNMTVLVNDRDYMPVLVRNQIASVSLGVSLSGAVNNGNADSYPGNLVTLEVSLSLASGRFKANDLKSLYFDITSLNG